MIGVVADRVSETVIREFFELFKTPWEFFQPDKTYDVVLCDGDAKVEDIATRLFLFYAGKKTAFDAQQKVQIHSVQVGPELCVPGGRLPIYGGAVTFRHEGFGGLTERHSGDSAVYIDRSGNKTFVRVGYDLFHEVHFLLTKGQPPENAGIPTLDMHISFLRDLITGCGVPLVEIPPVPDGCSFIGCLTHDIDFASIRGHKFDATMFGFLYRATVGSAVNASRGRLSLDKLLVNWAAAAKLPFVFLGLAKDFWYDFDRYLELEKGRPSTFFVIPFERRPGRRSEGVAPRSRGCRYDISQITPKIPRLKAAGCEIGLHGIDAWLDSSSGRAEAQRISQISDSAAMGVRMHWLYSDEKSASVLEGAEFSYDSTVGYNETIGYRAGTTQAFKPIQASRLLELPMHIMDTALFYPTHMNLSSDEAWTAVSPVLDNAVRFGGALTVNWHDRSIAPERLWGDFYERLLDEMTARGAWFSTAGQSVSWFRKRRSAVFEIDSSNGTVAASVAVKGNESLPGLRLRFHNGRSYIDKSFNSPVQVQFSN